MTTYHITSPADPDVLAAENARLRLAVAHLAVYAGAVLDAVAAGQIAITPQGPAAWQAQAALSALDDTTARVRSGDWPTVTPWQVAAAFDRHAMRHLLGRRCMNLEQFRAAVQMLLWHPERQSTTGLRDGTEEARP